MDDLDATRAVPQALCDLLGVGAIDLQPADEAALLVGADPARPEGATTVWLSRMGFDGRGPDGSPWRDREEPAGPRAVLVDTEPELVSPVPLARALADAGLVAVAVEAVASPPGHTLVLALPTGAEALSATVPTVPGQALLVQAQESARRALAEARLAGSRAETRAMQDERDRAVGEQLRLAAELEQVRAHAARPAPAPPVARTPPVRRLPRAVRTRARRITPAARRVAGRATTLVRDLVARRP